MSDTPRTDAFFTREHVAFDSMWIEFARQLERELAEASLAARRYRAIRDTCGRGEELDKAADRVIEEDEP